MSYKVQYIVKEDERVVICVINGTKNYFSDYMSHRLCQQNYLDNIAVYVEGKYNLKNSYSGVARCAPGDEWNEELGRKIAFNKAKEKLNSAFFKRAKTYVNEVDNWFNQLVGVINNYGSRLADDAAKREKEIEQMLGKKE